MKTPSLLRRQSGDAFDIGVKGSTQIPTPRILVFALAIPLALLIAPGTSRAASAQILGWNNLGMHCMDSDYSVFSILPPYNTIDAQLIVNGALVTASNGYTVTYQAVADPDGSINKTSAGKGNWLQYAPLLYGGVAADQGLPFPGPDSFWMPGTNNAPQGMLFDSGLDWFYAYGVPITPYDDAGKRNPYPMMRLIARNSSGTAIATNDIVLPVSDEMDCRACHASGAPAAAQPAGGWVWSENPERDYRLNILRLHDEKNFALHNALYTAALEARGFNSQGLYRGVVADGKPVLCAACHASEALAAPSYGTIPPLTTSVHGHHATVSDPDLNITLDNSANRAACYRCHPGSTTKCLRGAMGGAIAKDGTLEMQCQSCHGNMSTVGANNRVGWLMEPNCQSCHSGTATANSGQIRYTSCFDTSGNVRLPANQTFGTQPDTPAAGISLYRFSAGHSGLQCEACHGSTHAEFPATHHNDNLRNEKIQGHAGVMIECTACHVSMSVNWASASGGPHGMHPIGQSWVSEHHDFIASFAACAACHGVDYRGTVLSRAQTARSLTANFDSGSLTVNLYRGALVGCYTCHNGPFSESRNTNAPPSVSNVSANTVCGQSVEMTLPVSGAGAQLQIVSQPAHGSVGLSNTVATYCPEAGFVGTDMFTFVAYDGSKNSNLATGTVAVAQGPFALTAKTLVPPSYPANWAAPFMVVVTPSNIAGEVTFDWDFGDASAHGTNQYPAHAYATPGSYRWRVVSKVQSGINQASTTNSGSIVIGAPAVITPVASGTSVSLVWPVTMADALLEESALLGPDAHWTLCTNAVSTVGGTRSVTILNMRASSFYRLRKL